MDIAVFIAGKSKKETADKKMGYTWNLELFSPFLVLSNAKPEARESVMYTFINFYLSIAMEVKTYIKRRHS